jgi:tRNA-2-methylthio-N6-dimethylallyladenosine synthase
MREFNELTIGMEVPVLFDGTPREGQLHGRTNYNQAIHVQGNHRLYGHIETVRVTGTNGKSLTGDLVLQEAAA